MKLLSLSLIFCLISLLAFGQPEGQYSTTDAAGNVTVQFNSVDSSISCDTVDLVIAKYGSIDKIPDPDLKFLVLLAQLKCTIGAINQLPPQARDSSHYQVQMLVQEPTSPGNPRVLFNLVDLKSLTTAKAYAEALVNFAPAVIASQTGGIGQFLAQSGIVTAVGRYSVQAYYESALRNDPLIILYPGAIPAKQFSRDVIREFKRNKVYDEAGKIWKNPTKLLTNPLTEAAKAPAVILGGINKVIPKVKLKRIKITW